MKITVIDGQGGMLGSALVKEIVAQIPEATVTAIGTNSAATAAMLKAGATRAATGENPVVVACRDADFILGPIGIVIADSLLGEITPTMAAAVGASSAKRILIPMNKCDTVVAGVGASSTAELISDAVSSIKR